MKKRPKTVRVPLRKRDVLRELYEREISLDEADDIFESITSSPRVRKWGNLMGLSLAEATASAHAVPFDVIARWRYEGWPNVCVKCGKQIPVERIGWWAGSKKRGRFVLQHIACLP